MSCKNNKSAVLQGAKISQVSKLKVSKNFSCKAYGHFMYATLYPIDLQITTSLKNSNNKVYINIVKKLSNGKQFSIPTHGVPDDCYKNRKRNKDGT